MTLEPGSELEMIFFKLTGVVNHQCSMAQVQVESCSIIWNAMEMSQLSKIANTMAGELQIVNILRILESTARTILSVRTFKKLLS
jgi:hypothetical protein